MNQGNLYILPCFKTSKIKPLHEHAQALLYLKLRKSGCETKTAMNFCKIRHCKSDLSKIKYGPENFRIIEKKDCKENKLNTHKGWLLN